MGRTGDLATAATVFALVASAAPGLGAGEPDGSALYEVHCLACHGERGEGDGEKAKRLGFRPRDFSLGAFKCRSTPSGSPPTREDLLGVVRRGLPGTAMGSFEEKLSQTEREALVDYLEALLPAPVAEPGAAIAIPEPIAAGDETVGEGRQIYRLLGCWKCHGLEGRGDGPSARGLVDDWGERVRAYDFTRRKRFKCGGGDRDLYRLLHTGMTGSPMPSFSEALAFAADEVGDADALAAGIGVDAVSEIREYLGGQPGRATLAALDEAARGELTARRTWALVHYLRSLVRE